MGAELSIVVVTRNRADKLARTLASIHDCAAETPIEVLVADDGSEDNTREVVSAAAARPGAPSIRGIHATQRGISTARNEAIEAASGSAVLFLNDDTTARPGALGRHAAFHRERGDRPAAMLGLTISDPATLDSEFMIWLAGPSRIRWDLAADTDGRVDTHYFHGANTSIPTDLIRSVGGFDEQIRFGCEDHELGWRLEKLGVELWHDPDAVIVHDHATTLEQFVARLRIDGQGRRILCERHPEAPAPKRPGLSHRLAAAALTALYALHVTPVTIRHRAWLFLCHEAYREAFWGEPDPGPPHVRIGARLARIAYARPGTGAGLSKAGTQTAGP